MANYLNVPGAQLTKSEREFIKSCAEELSQDNQNLILFNIGIMWGGTLWCLRAGAKKAKLYGLDIAPNKWKIEDRETLNAVVIKNDSRTYWKEFEHDIDVLLIDGDHHYATVKQDIEGWVPKCKGIVIFHDYTPTEHNLRQFPELEGVKRAVDEYFSTHSEWVELPAPDSIKAFQYGKTKR